MGAPKQLRLVDARLAGTKATHPQRMVLDVLAEAALAERDRRRAVCVFVNSPAAADALVTRLGKAGVDPSRLVALTGTMRGYERAALTGSLAFRQFDPGPARESGDTAYFIATAAGEIGLDIDADVGLFDLTTLDRFIQRSGRINRRGLTVGDIVLVHAGGEELSATVQDRGRAALAMLETLQTSDGAVNASPLALSMLCNAPAYADAIEPAPAIRPLEPAIVDMLAMTSLRLDEIRCPSPEVFIRGLVDEEAELKLAWRQLPMEGTDFAAWLDAWPLLPTEQAKLPLEAAQRVLREVLMRAQQGQSGPLAVALDAQGLPAADQSVLMPGMRVDPWIRSLRPGSVALLSSALGGLNGQGLPSIETVDAVPDVSFGFTDADGMERIAVRRIEVEAVPGEDGLEWRAEGIAFPGLGDLVDTLAGDLEPAFHDGPSMASGEHWSGTVTVWLRRPALRSPDAGDAASLVGRDRYLDEHLDLAARAASRLSQHLGLPAMLKSALVRAAAEHDRGKAWAQWQRAIGNQDLSRPLGKSSRPFFDFKANDGYRHELGSIVDRGAALSELERHLVASHHGWARPVFRGPAMDKPGCARAALDCAEGFARLGLEVGPWALCYLEAVLKSADMLAEVIDSLLVVDAAPGLTPAPPQAPPPTDDDAFQLPVDIANFGEYLAALGLVALLAQRGERPRVGWEASTLRIADIPRNRVRLALESLRGATAEPDWGATVEDQRGAAYPPLVLRLGSMDIRLNHWLDEQLRGSSRWKMGAGQTTAIGTLNSVLAACQASLNLPDFEPSQIFRIGGGRVGADASKFRFDAATSWSARDAGFSLNESDALKSTRPWVELLSVLGLQYFFPPPADGEPAYHTWRALLPVPLALAAAKGLLPQSTTGLRPVIEPSGKMKDVFSSQPLFRERKPVCPPRVLVI